MDFGLEYQLCLNGEQVMLRLDRPDLIRHRWDGMGHNHAEYELHILLEGAFKVDVEGKSHLLSSGHALIIPPGQYHCPMPDAGKFERFSLCFYMEQEEGELAGALAQAVQNCRIYPATAEVLNICHDIFFEFSQSQIYGDDVMAALLLRLLVCNLRLLNVPVQMQPIRGETALFGKGDYNNMIDMFFETHLKDTPMADELAALLFVSRRQLSRLLQKNYGMSFREKLLRTRLDRASWLLRHTELSVGEVAAEVGYTVPASFFHVFRDNYGMTPEQYRAAKKNTRPQD